MDRWKIGGERVMDEKKGQWCPPKKRTPVPTLPPNPRKEVRKKSQKRGPKTWPPPPTLRNRRRRRNWQKNRRNRRNYLTKSTQLTNENNKNEAHVAAQFLIDFVVFVRRFHRFHRFFVDSVDFVVFVDFFVDFVDFLSSIFSSISISSTEKCLAYSGTFGINCGSFPASLVLFSLATILSTLQLASSRSPHCSSQFQRLPRHDLNSLLD